MEMLIGGKWCGAADGATEEVRSPFGLAVPISCGATGGRGVQRGQCPDRARGGQAS